MAHKEVLTNTDTCAQAQARQLPPLLLLGRHLACQCGCQAMHRCSWVVRVLAERSHKGLECSRVRQQSSSSLHALCVPAGPHHLYRLSELLNELFRQPVNTIGAATATRHSATTSTPLLLVLVRPGGAPSLLQLRLLLLLSSKV